MLDFSFFFCSFEFVRLNKIDLIMRYLELRMSLSRMSFTGFKRNSANLFVQIVVVQECLEGFPLKSFG